MRSDVHRSRAGQIAEVVDLGCGGVEVSRGGCVDHTFEDHGLHPLVLVQESAGVVRAVQKAEQDKNRATGEKRATRHAVFVRDFGLADLTAAKILPESPRLDEENDDQQSSGGI